MFFYLFYTFLALIIYCRGFRVINNTHFKNNLFSKMDSNILTSGSQKDDKKLVIVIGPTASGKTKFSIDLCKKLKNFNINSEIINADSMQVYKGFSVGTAKPSDDEIASVPHHLLNFVDPTVDYNASLFVKDCSTVVEDLFSQNKLPVIVGGTNLYIEGLLWPSVIDFDQHDDYESLEEEFKDYDSDTLYNILMEVDPDRAEELHKNDRKRVIRSLDVYHFHGVTHTDLMKMRKEEKDRTGIRYDVLIFVLKSDPEIHRKRIRDRVEFMLKNGIVDECRDLLSLRESNPHLDMRKGIFQSIAYKELIPMIFDQGFSQNLTDDLMEKCANVLETKTWRYSQRQKTWINNRLLRKGLKSHLVDTNDLNFWDKIVDENVKIVLEHLNIK